VGQNETVNVGADRTRSVGQNETITVGANRTRNVGQNESVTIGADETRTVTGNRTITVGTGSEIHLVTTGSRFTKIKQFDALIVEDGPLTAQAVLGVIAISALTEGVSISGKTNVGIVAETESVEVFGNKLVNITGLDKVNAHGNNEANVSSKKISITATDEIIIGVDKSVIRITKQGVEISGPKISSASVGVHEITGAVVKIN
jgi:type VI secretion system secreted protein VgrG